MTAAPSPAVLLLSWNAASGALPVANALATAATAHLWTAQPLPTGTLAPGVVVTELLPESALPPTPELLLSQAAPAFPYVGSSGSQAGLQPQSGFGVPAAPYIGRSETTNPPAAATAAQGYGRSFAVPAAPYLGATPAVAAPDRRVTQQPAALVAELPAAELPAAEPGPAEAAELSSDQPSLSATGQPAVPAPEAAPLLAQEIQQVAPNATGKLLSESVAEVAPAAAVAPAEAPAALAAPAVPAPAATPSAPMAVSAAELNARIIRYARHAAHLARENAFEIIFAPDWPAWLAGLELRQLTRRPLVVQVTELAADRPLLAEQGWVEALERLTLPHADRILVPDAATAARVQKLYRVPAARVHVLPPGAAPDLTAALVLDAHLSA